MGYVASNEYVEYVSGDEQVQWEYQWMEHWKGHNDGTLSVALKVCASTGLIPDHNLPALVS